MQVPKIFTPKTSPGGGRGGGYLQGGSYDTNADFVAQAGIELANSLRNRRQKSENFDISKRLITEANDLQADFDARKEAAPLGADGFTEEVGLAYLDRHEKLIDEYRKMGYSQDSLNDLDLRLSGIRQTYNGQAIAFQGQSYYSLVNKETGDAAVQLSQYATSNPMAIESALTELKVLLSNRPHLGADDAQKLYDHYEAVILQGAGEGLALYAPQEVVSALAPEEVTTTDVVTTASGDFNIDSYMQANRAAESGGNDAAKAKTSSATGRYQFLNSTWVEYYNKAFPNNGLTEAQILAKRTSGETQDAVMKVFTLENVQRLEQEGLPVTNASVYLMHFLGAGNAPAVLKAPAAQSVESVVDPASIASNRAVFNKVKTVGQLLEWAEQKAGASSAESQIQQVSTSRVVAPQVKRASAAPPPAPVVPVVPGNLPIDVREQVENADGTVSTVRTISISNDLGEILIPTVIDGRLVSESEAIAHYEETGEHLGVFKDAEEATAYAKWLHERHEKDLAPTGNPVLDRMTGAQRLDVLQKARAELSRNQAQNRAGVEVQMQNEITAYMETGEYAGEATTEEALVGAYGEVVGKQKYAQLQDAREMGPFVKELQQLSPAEIQARLTALKPTDTASPTYATELKTYQLVEDAARRNIEARDKDPAAYAYSQFNNVAKQLQNARTPAQRQAAYAALENAYKKLGTPPDQQFLLTKEMAQAEAERYGTLSPKAKAAQIETWARDMPAGLLANTLTQLSKTGVIQDVQLFGAIRNYPNGSSLMVNIFAGMDTIEKDSSRRPSADRANTIYREGIGTALQSLNPEASQLYKDAASALYVQMGGLAGKDVFDPQLYGKALRLVLGGTGAPDTGVINMGGTKVRDNTILPPGINKSQFENWIEGLAVGDLTRLTASKKPPVTSTGKSVPTQDIIDFGVFVMVAPGQYVVKMNNTGGTLMTGNGQPFLVRIRPETVRGRR